MLVVLPGYDGEATVRRLGGACRKLMAERIAGAEALRLSIAAGVVVTTDAGASPADLRKAADKVQYVAKERSRKGTLRPSVIAVEGAANPTVIDVGESLA